MRQRLWSGKPAEITFTGDFHELAAGDLRPGGPLLLRYDPHRIVPPGEPYRFGDPDRPVTAHLQFHEGESPLDVALRSPAGIIPCPDVDLTGQGSMLSAQLTVPADAERLIVWFSYESTAGTVLYDSDYGADYRFGFPGREIDVVQATITRRPDEPFDCFDVSLSATLAIEAVTVPFFLVADRRCAKHEIQLQRTDEAGAHPEARRWVASISVPHGAIVRFKICYWIGGRRLIDDNAGAWYLAPEPEPDRTPPPTSTLLEAAAAWS
jgi:uncharacterized protein DUF6209